MKLAATIIAAVVLGAPAIAAADDITIGLYAPTAPFEGSGDRVSFINGIAEHLAGVANGTKVTGKVYANASAFAAAVKKGEIQYAVVDAPYAAGIGLPYTVLATATRNNESAAPWQLVAKSSIGTIKDLKGAKVAIPTVGAKQQAFVTNVLLGAEVDATYFGSIVDAADARSAMTMITVGKADAAFVSSGVEPPAGTKRLLGLTTVGWPMFVALPGADAKLTTAFTGRIKSFGGAGGFSGFTDPVSYRSLVGAFASSNKRGPMAVPPPARLSVRDLLAGRTFTASVSDPLDSVVAPAAPAPAP
ncbi:MAG TPA: ABC transporter substrate-binding protein [Kofleriaceae bacterium]|jgi:hypothetical protein|nr:ABC transporter substrate-binding protein [Kofleriaceae bacterium]